MESVIKEVVDRIIQDYHTQFESSFKDDLVEILTQMIKSGDLRRYTTVDGMSGKVVYIPYARQERLKNEIEGLKHYITELSDFINKRVGDD